MTFSALPGDDSALILNAHSITVAPTEVDSRRDSHGARLSAIMDADLAHCQRAGTHDLLVAQYLYRIYPGRPPGRGEARQNSNESQYQRNRGKCRRIAGANPVN